MNEEVFYLNKVAIVTGASSGFGLLTTLELAERGFDVVATMRNTSKASLFESLTDKKDVLNRIHPFCLNVTDKEAIDKLHQKTKELARVDLLVNNAGFAMGGFCEEVSIDDYRRQFETNVFGVMAVTQAVLPKLRMQGFGTVINVSSVSGKVAFPGLSPYVSSKFALEGYSESLRLEVKPFGVNVALVEPGSFSTNIWSSGMEISDQSLSNESPYNTYMKSLTTELESGKVKHGDPKDVARLIGKLAVMKTIKELRHPIGKGTKLTLLLKQLIPWSWWEKMIYKKLVPNKRD